MAWHKITFMLTLPESTPETEGYSTQLYVSPSSGVGFKVAMVLVTILFFLIFWLWFNSRNGDLKTKLNSLFIKFRSLFKNEWILRLFLVLQIAGFIGIACLAIMDTNGWKLFPYKSWDQELTWDFLNSTYWTYHHENWFTIILLISPLLISKATDWISPDKKQTKPRNSWKNN